MKWLGWFTRADVMATIKTLLDRLLALIRAELRRLAGDVSQDRPGGHSDNTEDAATILVQRMPLGFLICVSAPLCGKRWEIPAHGLAIGRDPSADIVVDDARVSARHAHVRPGPGGVIVVDEASRNGVFLNTPNHRVDGQELLRPGDIVMLSATDAAHFVYCPPDRS